MAAAVTKRVAYATCEELPQMQEDDARTLEPLAAYGVSVDACVWSDKSVDWSKYDAVVLRSTWDYTARLQEFLEWTRRVPRLLNPPSVVAWNSDKVYLTQLAAANLPTIPTTLIRPGEDFDLSKFSGEIVIKPTVSAGSQNTGRYNMADAAHAEKAKAEVARLTKEGHTLMIQPYMLSVDTYGETGLLYFNGKFSHAMRKGQLLYGPYEPITGLYVDEPRTHRQPLASERALADRVVAALPSLVEGAEKLLYARIDLILDEAQSPLVLEIELTEPSLFFETSPTTSPKTFADALAEQLGITRTAAV